MCVHVCMYVCIYVCKNISNLGLITCKSLILSTLLVFCLAMMLIDICTNHVYSVKIHPVVHMFFPYFPLVEFQFL